MPNLSSSSIAIASASLLGLVLASAMGIFGKNHMPVEGRVRAPPSQPPAAAWASLTCSLKDSPPDGSLRRHGPGRRQTAGREGRERGHRRPQQRAAGGSSGRDQGGRAPLPTRPPPLHP